MKSPVCYRQAANVLCFGDLQRRILSGVPRPRSGASMETAAGKKPSGIVQQRRVDITDRLIKL